MLHKAIALGVKQYLLKPYKSTEVFRKIESILGSRPTTETWTGYDTAPSSERQNEVYRKSLAAELKIDMQAWVENLKIPNENRFVRDVIIEASGFKGACLTFSMDGVAEKFSSFEKALSPFSHKTVAESSVQVGDASSSIGIELDRLSLGIR